MRIETVLLVHLHYIFKVNIRAEGVYKDSLAHLILKKTKKLTQYELAFINAIFKEAIY
jgi:hypothetical protein